MASDARGQMIDRTQAPNAVNDGIAKSLAEQIGAGRGDWSTPNSSSFLISRDPYRHERNWDGTAQKEFLTRPLWGIGSKMAFGHDGRSVNLAEVVARHGGEAQSQRDAFLALAEADRQEILEFLRTLILFPPDDTASNLNPGDPNADGFPQAGHGNVRLTSLFNDPTDPE